MQLKIRRNYEGNLIIRPILAVSRLLVFWITRKAVESLIHISSICLSRILRLHLNLAKTTKSACSLKDLLHILKPYLWIRPTVLPVTLQLQESLPNSLECECSYFFIFGYFEFFSYFQ